MYALFFRKLPLSVDLVSSDLGLPLYLYVWENGSAVYGPNIKRRENAQEMKK